MCKNRFKKIIQSTLEIGQPLRLYRCCYWFIYWYGYGATNVLYVNQVGADSALGTAVSLSLIRELGPVLSALMIVAVASAFVLKLVFKEIMSALMP